MIAIGNWVRRMDPRAVTPDRLDHGKWHRVESVVDGEPVTRCGRRMKGQTDDGILEVSEVEPLTRLIGQPQNCKRC